MCSHPLPLTQRRPKSSLEVRPRPAQPSALSLTHLSSPACLFSNLLGPSCGPLMEPRRFLPRPVQVLFPLIKVLFLQMSAWLSSYFKIFAQMSLWLRHQFLPLSILYPALFFLVSLTPFHRCRYLFVSPPDNKIQEPRNFVFPEPKPCLELCKCSKMWVKQHMNQCMNAYCLSAADSLKKKGYEGVQNKPPPKWATLACELFWIKAIKILHAHKRCLPLP